MGGHRFLELAAAIPGVAITVFGEEPRTAYDPVARGDGACRDTGIILA